MYFLNLGYHVITKPLGLADELLKAILNSLLAPLAYWYQELWSGNRNFSLIRGSFWILIVSANTVAPAPPFLMTAITTKHIRLIQKRKVTVWLPVRDLLLVMSVEGPWDLSSPSSATETRLPHWSRVLQLHYLIYYGIDPF